MKLAGVIALLALVSVAVGDLILVKSRCALKPDPGPCRGAFKKWFFNPKTKQCESFIYGGCDGVVPFNTEAECERQCEDPCKLKPDPGPCKAYIPSWFFNQITKRCERFIWGGCKGTRPFTTLEACQKRCDSRKDPCDLTPKDVLPPRGTITCQAFFTSWYFNKFSGRCESFSYSACSNLGPFETENECVSAKCKCKLRPEDTNTGPVTCQAFWTTWFYNEHTRRCDKFSYSGCGSIGFTSESKCLDSCP